MKCRFIMRNTTNKCIHRYINLLYYTRKQRSLLHVSATYCDHLQGGVICRIYYIESQNNSVYKHETLGFK